MNRNFSSKDFSLGILGGGQLGRMLLQKTMDFNLSTAVMDGDADAPCKNICDRFVNASFADYDAVYQFGKSVNLLTIEIEHVNTDALIKLESEGLQVYPQPSVLAMVKDKGLQKIFYRKHKFPTADFALADNKAGLEKLNTRFPMIQKLRSGGYDGKGVLKINSALDFANAFDEPSVLEECVDFEKEISVIVARNSNGQVAAYPAVEMLFNPEANLVEFLASPANINEGTAKEAKELAIALISQLEMTGVLAVEMFVTKSGSVLINEIAPRPHNSGHHTIEANITSQYEQHIRAILNLPLGSTDIIRPAVMINLLGEKGHSGIAKYEGLEDVLQMDSTYVHLYGKKMTKPFRKMGHVTVTGKTIEGARNKALLVKEKLRVISE